MKKVKKGIAMLLSVCIMLSLMPAVYASAESELIYDSDTDFATYTTKEDLYKNTDWSDGPMEHWDDVGLTVNKDTSENAEYPNYITVIGNHSAQYTLSEPVKSGKLRVSAAVRIPESHAGLIDVADSNGNAPWLVGFYGDKTWNTLYNSAEGKKFLNYIPNEWYDFSIVFDLDAKTYSIQLKNGGNVIWAYRDLPLYIFDGKTNNTFMNEIKSIRFRQWAKTLDIGRLVIEKIPYEDDSDFVLCSENFEKVTNDNLANYGIEAWWAVFSEIATIEVPDGETSKMMTVVNDKHAAKKIPALESGKKYKFSYTEKVSNSRLYLDIIPRESSSSNALVLPWVYNGSAYCMDYVNNDATKLADVSVGDLIRFEAIYDSARKTVESSVFNAKTGAQIGSTVKTSVPDAVVNHMVGNRTLHISKWGGGGTYIDDFVFEYYIERPSLSDEKVSMTDYNGNPIEITAQTETITPAIKSIALDFGETVKETSVEGAVTLKTKSGADVDFYGELSDIGVYTMTLSKMLDKNTDYVLNVDKSVVNENGYAMSNDYSMEFTTSSIDSVVKLTGAEADGATATIAAATTAGKVVNVNTEMVNADAVEKQLIYIISYYKNNVLLSAEAKNATAAAGAITAAVQSFTVPQGVSEADTVKVFLWNTSNDMRAYCKPITIN